MWILSGVYVWMWLEGWGTTILIHNFFHGLLNIIYCLVNVISLYLPLVVLSFPPRQNCGIFFCWCPFEFEGLFFNAHQIFEYAWTSWRSILCWHLKEKERIESDKTKRFRNNINPLDKQKHMFLPQLLQT